MKKVLLTGASGFLGSFLINLTEYEGETLGRGQRSTIRCDLSKEVPDLNKYDLIIHAAGKAHSVPKTDVEREAFFKVNVDGTKNLLKGLERAAILPKSFVFISTVAVYGLETGLLINEQSFLNANDPYGQSKIQAENLVEEWCARHNVICSILRLPLIVGENPPGNLGAMIKAIKKGYYFNIGGGLARKSMVLAKDVAKFIPRVAKIGGIYNLTDGKHPSFAELSSAIAEQLNKSKPINIPLWLAKIIALAGDFLGAKAPINTNKLKKITSDLTFDDSHAKNKLDWNPTPVLTKDLLNSEYGS